MGHEMTDSADQLTVQQVAKELGTRPATVRRWLAAGAFPGAWKPTDSRQANWRIPRASVNAWLNRDRRSGP